MKLFQNVKRYFAGGDCDISLPAGNVQKIIKKHTLEDWFFYSFVNRSGRRHICEPSLWILNNIQKQSVIFENGCGCAFNLIWLAQKGFIHLSGSDISSEAVSAGKEIASLANLNIELWQDNGMNPERLPDCYDVLLALNWTYHVENFNFINFINKNSITLKQNGYIVIDLIDISYNNTPNNEYLTSDWHKPIDMRLPSEYKTRYSYEDVARMVSEVGFEVDHIIKLEQLIPRFVYILRKR